jgi:hypothetical protein
LLPFDLPRLFRLNGNYYGPLLALCHHLVNSLSYISARMETRGDISRNPLFFSFVDCR